MKDDYIKVFTDNSLLVNRLNSLLNDADVSTRISDGVESARLGGFGAPINSVQLFVLNIDLEKAQPVIESFKDEINS